MAFLILTTNSAIDGTGRKIWDQFQLNSGNQYCFGGDEVHNCYQGIPKNPGQPDKEGFGIFVHNPAHNLRQTDQEFRIPHI